MDNYCDLLRGGDRWRNVFFFFRTEAPVIFSWDGRAFCLLACVRDSTEQLPTNLKPWSEWSCETYIGKQHALVRRSWLEQIKWSYTWFNSVKQNGHRRWPPGFMDKSPDTCRSGDKGERLRDRSWVVATTGGGLGLVQRSTVERGIRPSRRIRVLVTVSTVVLRCRAWPIEVPVVSSRLSSGTTMPRPGTTRWMSPERNEWLRWEKVVHKGEKERGGMRKGWCTWENTVRLEWKKYVWWHNMPTWIQVLAFTTIYCFNARRYTQWTS